MLVAASRAEAARLVRNPLVAAGLAGSAACVYWNNYRQIAIWWSADVGIGAALLIAAGAVLVVTHLAAGRVRRDSMSDLYDSYPAAPAVRIGGVLFGVAGPAVLAALMVAAAVAWLDIGGAVGSPRLTVLAAGLLLVPLGGAIGAALGSWLPHPLVGLLAAVVLGLVELDVVLAFDGWVQVTGPVIWLLPWTWNGVVLGSMPQGIAAMPPPAHAAELAGLTGLAVAAALWRTRPSRQVLVPIVAVSLALTAWSGWAQDNLVPLSQLTRLVYEATRPVQTQQCSTVAAVRYCYYPEFRPIVSRIELPVNGVLGLVPDRPARPLVVRQPADLAYLPPLAPASPATAVARLELGLGANIDKATLPRGDIVADPVGWGAGAAAGASELSVAANVARWATGLSAATPAGCMPLSQAREPIALWLAASATSATRTAFAGSIWSTSIPTKVGTYWIDTPYAGYMQVTSQGLALVREMLRLPAGRVKAVLAAHWATWLRPSATDSQLAAALGLPAPRLRTVPGIGRDGHVPGTNEYVSPTPAAPVCR
jgi:hypothetical protein